MNTIAATVAGFMPEYQLYFTIMGWVLICSLGIWMMVGTIRSISWGLAPAMAFFVPLVATAILGGIAVLFGKYYDNAFVGIVFTGIFLVAYIVAAVGVEFIRNRREKAVFEALSQKMKGR